MNVYLIDDDALRHKLLPEVLSRLNRTENAIEWCDGFRGCGQRAYENAESLIQALEDSEGLLLLDIELTVRDTDVIPEILSRLKTRFQSIPAVESMYNSPMVAHFKAKPEHYISTFVLSAALALSRHFVLVTRLPAEGEFARRTARLPHCFMPTWDAEKSRWTETLDFLVGEIMANVNDYDRAAASWERFKRSASLLFPTGDDGHTAKGLLSAMNGSGNIDPEILQARLSILCTACATLTERLPKFQLDAAVAVVLGRAASRGEDRIAVPFLEALAGLVPSVSSPFCCVDCQRVSPGRLAWGIYVLSHRRNEEVKSVVTDISAPFPQKVKIRFTATYKDQDSASQAAETLRMTPMERMDKHKRKTPGTAVEACYWLRQEAGDDWSIRESGQAVCLEYSFDAVNME